MTWVRLDDGFPTHPKVLALSDRAFRAHVMGLCYASQHHTDGFVQKGYVPDRAAAELVEGGLWEPIVGREGFQIHDFLTYNLSRSEWQALSQKRSKAGSKGAARRWQGDSKAIADPTRPKPDQQNQDQELPATPVAATLNQRGNELATAYMVVQPMANFLAIAGIAKKALKAKHPDANVRDALLRLAAEGRSVTVETLRIELEGLPIPRKRRPDNAALLMQKLEGGMDAAPGSRSDRGSTPGRLASG